MKQIRYCVIVTKCIDAIAIASTAVDIAATTATAAAATAVNISANDAATSIAIAAAAVRETDDVATTAGIIIGADRVAAGTVVVFVIVTAVITITVNDVALTGAGGGGSAVIGADTISITTVIGVAAAVFRATAVKTTVADAPVHWIAAALVVAIASIVYVATARALVIINRKVIIIKITIPNGSKINLMLHYNV